MKRTKFKETEIGRIPEDWGVKTFKNVSVDIIDGYRGINYPPKSDFKSEGFCLFLNTKNVPHYRFDFSECDFIDKERDQLLRKGKLQSGDLVLTTRGTVGNIAHFHDEIDFSEIRINSGMVILRNQEKDFETKFLYLMLRSSIIRNQIVTYSTGSAQPQLPIRDINKIKLPIPPMAEQKAIAKILSDLDSKIELNLEMNKTLEAIGQALFKRWFVDFEFPNENGEPYKSSNGEMVDSELGAIPKGWEVVELKECGDIICGKTPSTKNKDNYGDDMPFITIPDMRGQVFVIKTEKKLSLVGAKTQNKKELPPLSVCVSCIATPGLVSLTSESSHTNQQINSIVCREGVSPYFIYLIMNNMSEQIKLLGLGGTATLNLNTGNFGKIKITCPLEKLMRCFHALITIIFDRILQNINEIESLSQIRNSLLPCLMSGKVRVKEKEWN
ncbi:restriction endonuclease subunit S [candidate division WOR-3 bacterium]|nr:restriction endonuclease subunit S [candidate division WOR-3 bacterium]